MSTPQKRRLSSLAAQKSKLVCMACFLACMAREISSKVIAIWQPIAAFVASGLDHVVANMFFVPTAIFLHTNDISVGLYNWESMIPAVIGNIVGGSLFVGVVCWYLHLAGEDAESVDGLSFEGDAPFDGCSAQPSGVEGSNTSTAAQLDQMRCSSAMA